MPPLLQLERVAKFFDGARALGGVSFELRPGEVHALLGENGAGKSTLVKIISGAHQPDRGELRIRGEPTRHLNPAAARRLGVACLHQQPALFPDLSVAENIALRLEPVAPFRRVRWDRRGASAAALLARVGARIDPQTDVGSLSMPEQQLVEIACTLGTGADIVLMDEPTASLTQAEQTLLFEAVRGLRSQGAGVIYISHRLEEIFALADRVTVLRDGLSVGCWPVAEVDEPFLIQQMIGREAAPAVASPAGRRGACKLSLHEFGCDATGVGPVSLELHAGEIVGLAGLVGAGRTGLLEALFGVTPGTEGGLRLDGQPVHISSPADAMARGIALLPEDRRRHGVIPEMSVAANLSLAAQSLGPAVAWLRPVPERQLALRLMRDLSVRAAGPEAPVQSLSGGNQQKVALGRWLAIQPRILLLDEPTQGVDVGAKAEIHAIIRDLARGGMAVLLVSSDLPEILALSDRIAVMRGGRLERILPAGSPAGEIMAAALSQMAPS